MPKTNRNLFPVLQHFFYGFDMEADFDDVP